MRTLLFVMVGLVCLPACGDAAYPVADFFGKSLTFVSASVSGFKLTSTDQDVNGRPTRIECPDGFTFAKAAKDARDRSTGQTKIVAMLDGELTIFVNDGTGLTEALAIDFEPEGQGQDCDSGCVSWLGTFQESTWINGTAKVVDGNLEIEQFNNATGAGLTIEVSTGLVMSSLTLAK